MLRCAFIRKRCTAFVSAEQSPLSVLLERLRVLPCTVYEAEVTANNSPQELRVATETREFEHIKEKD